MILKSFEIEKNIKNISKSKFTLIYGENLGLKDKLKDEIIKIFNNYEIIHIYQEDFNKNKNILVNEFKNSSLFSNKKLIIVHQASDKLTKDIEILRNGKEDTKIVMISELLDKKSKLRYLFEKDKELSIIPCYNDNDYTLQRIVVEELKDFRNLTKEAIELILETSSKDRKKILNNIQKIKTYFEKKIIQIDELENLLNSDRNEIFENIRDAALLGNKDKLNRLLNNFTFNQDDTFQYLNMINFRLIKLLELHNFGENNDLAYAINNIKPAIFWKERPIMLQLAKKWQKQTLNEALIYIGHTEEMIKKNSYLNSTTLLKNSVTNLCSKTWSYF